LLHCNSQRAVVGTSASYPVSRLGLPGSGATGTTAS